MILKLQKRLAAAVTGNSEQRIRFDTARLSEVKEAITKSDVRSLIKDRAIYIIPRQNVSRGRARKIRSQKSKGKQSGHGTRKGKHTARLGRKEAWIHRIRLQRKVLQSLREKKKITDDNYRMLYGKSQAGFFRSERHLKLFIEENHLFVK